MPEEIPHATTRLSASGSSEHVRIPKPLRPLLKWAKGEDLIVTILDDESVRVVTLERYVRERMERNDRERRAAAGEAPR